MMMSLFLPYINMNQTGIHVPHTLEPPLISHPIPFLQIVTEHCVVLPVSYRKFPPIIYFTYGNVYEFQCYSLKSSHPPLPPLCPQVCSLCLCLYCFPTDRFISIAEPTDRFINITFLDSINVLIYDTCFSISDLFKATTLRLGTQSTYQIHENKTRNLGKMR